MMAQAGIVIAAAGGLISVALGAAGTHLVAGDAHAAELIDLASRYLMVHALAMLGICGLGGNHRTLQAATALFALGMVLFSGGLVVLALTGARIAALATPLGGSALMLGWVALGLFGVKR